jgi:predicted transcriptional regulator
MLTIRLKRTTASRLGRLAKKTGQAETKLAGRLLEQKLREDAEYDRWFRREVAAGIREADAGHVISHEEAMRRLDRWKAKLAGKSRQKS